jgi:tetratricopeptide (TPR) repeat protein
MVARYYSISVRDYSKAQKLYYDALALALKSNSHLVQADALYGLATIKCLQGAWLEGLRLSHEIQRTAVAAGNIRGELLGLECQARSYLGLGNFTHAMQAVDKWKALILPAGMQGGESEIIMMGFEGEVYHLKTEYAEARHIGEMILSHTSLVLSPMNYAYALINLVSLDLATGGCTDTVSHNLQSALRAFQHINYPRGISLCELHATELNLCKGETSGARDQYMYIFSAVYAIDNELACYCLGKLADSNQPVHAASEIARWAVIFLAFTMHQSRRSVPALHQALRCLGDILAQQGKDDDAISVLTVALEGFTWMDVHQRRAECMRSIGDVYFRHGDIRKASTFWTEARPLFQRSIQAKAVSEIDVRLAELSGDATEVPEHVH